MVIDHLLNERMFAGLPFDSLPQGSRLSLKNFAQFTRTKS